MFNLSGANPDDLARLDRLQHDEQAWHERSESLETGVWRDKDDKPKRDGTHVLLVFQVLIGRNEGVER